MSPCRPSCEERPSDGGRNRRGPGLGAGVTPTASNPSPQGMRAYGIPNGHHHLLAKADRSMVMTPRAAGSKPAGRSQATDVPKDRRHMRLQIQSFSMSLMIVAVNWLFSVAPLVTLPDGTMWPPVSLVVGFVFVARDFAQARGRASGDFAGDAGSVRPSAMSWPTPIVALASAAAFLISEFADWAVYSFTGRSLSQRILFSSALERTDRQRHFPRRCRPAVTPAGVLAMTVSKMLGAVVVWWLVRRREATAAS